MQGYLRITIHQIPIMRLYMFKEVKGTASELFDNRQYDVLVEMVGEEGAEKAITHKLAERGLTVDEWQKYRKVRSVIHTNPLKIKEEVKQVDEIANTAISC